MIGPPGQAEILVLFQFLTLIAYFCVSFCRFLNCRNIYGRIINFLIPQELSSLCEFMNTKKNADHVPFEKIGYLVIKLNLWPSYCRAQNEREESPQVWKFDALLKALNACFKGIATRR